MNFSLLKPLSSCPKNSLIPSKGPVYKYAYSAPCS